MKVLKKIAINAGLVFASIYLSLLVVQFAIPFTQASNMQAVKETPYVIRDLCPGNEHIKVEGIESMSPGLNRGRMWIDF